MSTPPTTTAAASGAASPCCENGRPIMTDPHTGQTICSCQYPAGLLAAAYSRVPGLAEGVYPSPYTAQGLMSLGAADPSAFYAPMVSLTYIFIHFLFSNFLLMMLYFTNYSIPIQLSLPYARPVLFIFTYSYILHCTGLNWTWHPHFFVDNFPHLWLYPGELHNISMNPFLLAIVSEHTIRLISLTPANVNRTLFLVKQPFFVSWWPEIILSNYDLDSWLLEVKHQF